MSKLRSIGALLVSSSLLAAGACSSKDDTKAGAAEPPVLGLWSVADAVGTKLALADLTATLNARTELAKLTADALLLPLPETAKLSRLATGIDACIAKKLKDLPIGVTSDSLRLEYSLDLTGLCDEAPKATGETVTEISNTARGLLIIGCPGGDFRRFVGKTLNDARGSGGTCAGAELTWYALDMQFTARKVTKTTTNGVDTLKVTVQEGRTMWSKADGKACHLRRHPESNDFVDAGDCRLAFTVRTFDGTPENEAKLPTDVDGPRVIAAQEDFSPLTAEPSAPFYSNGAVNFAINGWHGALTYSNGWAPPRWDAKKDSESAAGTLGQAAPPPAPLHP